MTKRFSAPDENGFRCEVCDEPKSIFRTQTLEKIRLGGGLGEGTMYVCSQCLPGFRERRARDARMEMERKKP